LKNSLVQKANWELEEASLQRHGTLRVSAEQKKFILPAWTLDFPANKHISAVHSLKNVHTELPTGLFLQKQMPSMHCLEQIPLLHSITTVARCLPTNACRYSHGGLKQIVAMQKKSAYTPIRLPGRALP